MTRHVFNPPERLRYAYYPSYCRTISDEDFEEAVGLFNARWFKLFYDLSDPEDLTRIHIQGKQLGYWLRRLEEIEKLSANAAKES